MTDKASLPEMAESVMDRREWDTNQTNQHHSLLLTVLMKQINRNHDLDLEFSFETQLNKQVVPRFNDTTLWRKRHDSRQTG